jgi:O-acetyl-ADP-ribose deacetylase
VSGGVNDALLIREGAVIEEELRTYLRGSGRSTVAPGAVVITGAGPLNAKKTLHAVAIDPFYDSSVSIVRRTLERAIATAQALKAKSVAMPTVATGFGHLSIEQFAESLSLAMKTNWSPIEPVVVVVRTPENTDILWTIVP